ncbi:MAG: hypothetical protein HY393_02465 [Candidatus Diapherotrites archaeon]|nr:hypothetical protein [Candidatus Diapherotrites archaeon]
MIVLLEHMDYFTWMANGQGAVSIQDSESDRQGSEHNCLVAYVTVENTDKMALDRAVKIIHSKALQFNVSSIVIYPFCHSPVKLAAPEKAAEIILSLQKKLCSALGDRITVKKAPFGTFKMREGRNKGHRESVLLRVVR